MTPRDRKPQEPPAPTPQEVAEVRARARQIGKLLHIAFDDITREPVPSEFLRLLGELEAREKRRLN